MTQLRKRIMRNQSKTEINRPTRRIKERLMEKAYNSRFLGALGFFGFLGFLGFKGTQNYQNLANWANLSLLALISFFVFIPIDKSKLKASIKKEVLAWITWDPWFPAGSTGRNTSAHGRFCVPFLSLDAIDIEEMRGTK